jgi:hypothetical protein
VPTCPPSRASVAPTASLATGRRAAGIPAPRSAAAASLSSLSAPLPPVTVLPVRRVSCAHCGSVRTTTISMTLTDGSPVDFTSCRACEGKTWAGECGPIGLPGVLARATRRRA